MTVLRKVWLCAWRDGRCHPAISETKPDKWAKLEADGECIVSEVPAVPFPDPPQSSRTPVKPAA